MYVFCLTQASAKDKRSAKWLADEVVVANRIAARKQLSRLQAEEQRSMAADVHRKRIQAQEMGDAERMRTTTARRENCNAVNEVTIYIFYYVEHISVQQVYWCSHFLHICRRMLI